MICEKCVRGPHNSITIPRSHSERETEKKNRESITNLLLFSRPFESLAHGMAHGYSKIDSAASGQAMGKHHPGESAGSTCLGPKNQRPKL